MANDASLAVRRAVVTALKADTTVSALVGDRVYGPRPKAEPQFPFIRYAPPRARPFRASGLDGSKVVLTLDAFAQGQDETAVSDLAAAIPRALERRSLPMAGFAGKLSHIVWDSTDTLSDPDGETWHAVISLTATISSPPLS